MNDPREQFHAIIDTSSATTALLNLLTEVEMIDALGNQLTQSQLDALARARMLIDVAAGLLGDAFPAIR